MAEPLIVALSRLAARVQRGRTTEKVLEIAGLGVRRLGLRFVAFQIEGDELVLRSLATVPRRSRAIEALIGRPLRGLRAPLANLPYVQKVIVERENVYRPDLDLFVQFLRESTGHDPAPLDDSPATAGIANGVLAPIFVGDRPWGLLAVVSPRFRAEDAAVVALFATHVGSALEAAEFIEELVRREHLAALGELSAVVAHEVRNPIGAIFNAVALLRRMPDGRSADARGLLDVISEEAARLNQVVSGLLEFASPSGPSLQRASILEIAREVVATTRERAEAARIELRLDAPRDLPSVDVDVRLVRQALLNLVVGGLEAMPAGGVLTLRARLERTPEPQRSFALLQVIDTAPGVPTAGSRLGLPVVKRVIESHGGDVGLESGPGGTTFTLRLPVPAARTAGRPRRARALDARQN